MINLLPPEEKQVLALGRNLKIVLILGTLFLIFLFSLSLVLFFLKTFILNQVESGRERLIRERKAIKISEAQKPREEIRSIHSNLSKLDSYFEKQFFLTDVFEKISELLPKETYLTSFSYRRDKMMISIFGLAPTREILFLLKKNFEAEDQVKNLNFPLSNWVKPKDIEFSLNFELDVK